MMCQGYLWEWIAHAEKVKPNFDTSLLETTVQKSKISISDFLSGLTGHHEQEEKQ